MLGVALGVGFTLVLRRPLERRVPGVAFLGRPIPKAGPRGRLFWATQFRGQPLGVGLILVLEIFQL